MHGTRLEQILAAVALMIVAYVIYQTAWLCDDAFITLRTVDNAVNGFGLRWNVAERVQAFTHPAWLAVQLPLYALNRDPFLTPLLVQAALSLTTFGWMLWTCRRQPVVVAALALLVISSKALVDFSTSGLENPLVHLVLVGLAADLARPPHERSGLRTGLLVSVLVLSRMDLILLVAPALIVDWDRRRWRAVALGLLPLVGWEIFSLIYYGMLVPNTALAKLGTGLDLWDTLLQGLRYWQATALIDPVTPLALLGLMCALMWRRGRAAVVGAWLYAGYTVYVGGDFMSGRFMTAPLVWLLAHGTFSAAPREILRPGVAAIAAAAVLVLGLGAATPPWRSGADFGGGVAPMHFGVTDERHQYYASLGLARAVRDGSLGESISHDWAVFGRRVREETIVTSQAQVRVASNVGLFGYFAGPRVHIIDRYALTEPLLARIPALPSSRVGHFERPLPDGYVMTRLTGQNQIVDPALAALHDRVTLLTQAPLGAPGRWSEILRQLRGAAPGR